METVTAVLVGVVIGALAVILIRRLRGGGGGPPGVALQCSALVKLSLVNGKIYAKPDWVCLHRTRPLIWEIAAGSGDEVNIEFANDGPFDHVPSPQNPKPGHYKKIGPGEVDSNPSRLNGQWKYTVRWRSGGNTVTEDPAVCIRGN